MHWWGSRRDDADLWPSDREVDDLEIWHRRRGEGRGHRFDNQNWFPMLGLVAGSLIMLAFAAAKHG